MPVQQPNSAFNTPSEQYAQHINYPQDNHNYPSLNETTPSNGKIVKKKRNRVASRYTYSPTDRIQFLFPRSRQLFESVEDKFHVRSLLQQQNKKNKVNVPMHTYCFERGQRSYLYTKCIGCGNKQKLKYVKTNSPGEKFYLHYFDNTHNHENYLKKRKPAYNVQEVYAEFLKAPKNVLVDDFREVIKNKYNITDSNFYYMLSRFRRNNETIKTLVQYFLKHGSSVWTELDKFQNLKEAIVDQDPKFLMFSFPQMADNYVKYGDCCYFTVIKGFVRKKIDDVDREWVIVSFNGLSYNNRFAPFALGFLEPEDLVQQIVTIFRQLLHKFKKVPKTFITPSDSLFIEVFEILYHRNIFNGLHLLDSIEELELIQEKLANLNYFKFFQEVVNSTSKAEYNLNFQRLLSNVEMTPEVREVLVSFNKKAARMCFSHIETDNFIGMAFKYSANRYMSILLRYLFVHSNLTAKTVLPRPKDLYGAAKILSRQFLKLMEEQLPYIRFDTVKYELHMHLPELHAVRNHLKSTVLDIFLAQFNKIHYVNVRPVPNRLIYDIYDKSIQSIFMVAAEPEYSQSLDFKRFVWRCTCLYSKKCGMPCAHEIKVTLMAQTSLLDQINDRWIMAKIGKKKAPGRPKVSRRNTMK